MNYAKAVFNALKKNAETRITKNEIQNISILSGKIILPSPDPIPVEKEE